MELEQDVCISSIRFSQLYTRAEKLKLTEKWITEKLATALMTIPTYELSNFKLRIEKL